MSTRIEWASVGAETLYSAEPGYFEDGHGSESDGPALGVFTGSDGWVIEAKTPEALADWLEEWARLIRQRAAEEKTNGHLPATAAQLAAIERRAELIEREVVGPFTRNEARAEIARLDQRIKDLTEDGVL